MSLLNKSNLSDTMTKVNNDNKAMSYEQVCTVISALHIIDGQHWLSSKAAVDRYTKDLTAAYKQCKGHKAEYAKDAEAAKAAAAAAAGASD